MKNKYSGDNKYLAIVTENGLWIKDEIENKINIINASKIEGKYLKDVTINQFSDDYSILLNIVADEIIENNIWIIKKEVFPR